MDLYTTPTARAGRKEAQMNKYRLLFALIIALAAISAWTLGSLAVKLLDKLPSPWNIVSLILWGILGLTLIIYMILGLLLDKKGGPEHGED